MAKVEYKDIKESLKHTFEDFVHNPQNYVSNEEQIKEIEDLNMLEKHSLWKSFKDRAKEKISELSHENIADVIIIDLEEDQIKITKSNLKSIIKHPEDYKDVLDESTLEYINNLGEEDKNRLFETISEHKHLGIIELPYHESKILSFLHSLWQKIAPIVDELVDKLVDFGMVALMNLAGQNIKNEMGRDIVEDLIENSGKIVKDIDLSAIGNVNEPDDSPA